MTMLDHTNESTDLDNAYARTTAQGLFNYGDSYLGSAHALKATSARVVFPDDPVRFLLYHAAEMHLKSFLRAAGMTVRELRQRGHKFSRLIPAAREHGLGLDRDSENILLYGQRTGDIIISRYIRTGTKVCVDTDTLGRCAANVRRAVRLCPQRVGHIVLWGEQTGTIDDHWERAWGI